MEDRAAGSKKFTYEALKSHFGEGGLKHPLWDSGYMACILPDNPSFIGFAIGEDASEEVSEDGRIFKEYGLKFHISLPEFDEAMYKRGWDIVRNILFFHKVQGFKIIRPGKKMSDVVGQEGKDVTVYVDAEPNRTAEEWKIILEDVTNCLAQEGIKPGYRPPGTVEKPERPVKGTNYVTYRYENDKEDRNWPEPDPCERIEVECKFPQLEIPVLVRQEKLKKIEPLMKPM